jgi:hypothetical protein
MHSDGAIQACKQVASHNPPLKSPEPTRLVSYKMGIISSQAHYAVVIAGLLPVVHLSRTSLPVAMSILLCLLARFLSDLVSRLLR